MRENHSVAVEPEPVSVQVVEWINVPNRNRSQTKRKLLTVDLIPVPQGQVVALGILKPNLTCLHRRGVSVRNNIMDRPPCRFTIREGKL